MTEQAASGETPMAVQGRPWRRYLKKAFLLYILALLTAGNISYVYYYFKYPVVYRWLFGYGINSDVVFYLAYELFILFLIYLYDRNRYVLSVYLWIAAAVAVAVMEVHSLFSDAVRFSEATGTPWPECFEWDDVFMFLLESLPIVLLASLYAWGFYGTRKRPVPAAAG